MTSFLLMPCLWNGKKSVHEEWISRRPNQYEVSTFLCYWQTHFSGIYSHLSGIWNKWHKQQKFNFGQLITSFCLNKFHFLEWGQVCKLKRYKQNTLKNILETAGY